MKNQWKSQDFYLSAVCIASGCKLKRLERKSGDLVEFIFEDSPEKCIEIISRYWARNLSLDARALIEAINEIRTRIHSNA